MSAKRRIARALALALIAGGALAPAASAGSIQVHAEIYGAGSIEAGTDPLPYFVPCERLEPATDADLTRCPEWGLGLGPFAFNVYLRAQPRPGWEFMGWRGCDVVNGSFCRLSSSSGSGVRTWLPAAYFVDTQAPRPVADLALHAITSEQGAYEATWTHPEPHLSYRCAVDDGKKSECAPGERFKLAEGKHAIVVDAVDPNGNVGDARSTTVTVVDTELAAGPGERAKVTSAAFSARSGFGTDFECALDGGRFAACGAAPSGENAPLTLPALAAGEHTLNVRARRGSAYDLSPVARTFTIVAEAPGTPPRPVPTVAPAAPSPATAPAAPAAAAPEAKLRLRYRYRKGRFTRLTATGVPAGTKLKITVKCPKAAKCPKRPRTLAKLIGKRLAPGTRITVRAGAQQVTLKIRRGRGPIRTAARGR